MEKVVTSKDCLTYLKIRQFRCKVNVFIVCSFSTDSFIIDSHFPSWNFSKLQCKARNRGVSCHGNCKPCHFFCISLRVGSACSFFFNFVFITPPPPTHPLPLYFAVMPAKMPLSATWLIFYFDAFCCCSNYYPSLSPNNWVEPVIFLPTIFRLFWFSCSQPKNRTSR